MADETFLTDCGLPGIQKIPYGLHACHFYPDRAQLVDALVPFFLAGLYNSEKCLWVAAPPLPAAEARESLQDAWDGTEDALARGALRIVDFDAWYGNGPVTASEVVEAWLKEEESAILQGYRGLRITGNTSFLDRPEDWDAFIDYERELNRRLSGRRIVVLCSYSLADCSARHAVEVMRAHDCALDRPDAGWQVMSGRIP